MRRFVSFQIASLSIGIGLWLPGPLGALTLVAPQVSTVGVESGTAEAFEALLVQEIDRRIDGRLARPDAAGRPCAEPRCAARYARRLGADGAMLASLTRLGEQYVATLQRVDPAGHVVWSEERTAQREEDLGPAAAALATALFAPQGREGPRSSPDGPEREPDGVGMRPRQSWSSQGPRVGMMGSVGNSYAGAGLLTSLAYVWRYQTPSFNVEVVPAMGLAWGGDVAGEDGQARDWTLLDLFVAWTPFHGDIAPYAGAGLGLHAIKLKRQVMRPTAETLSYGTTAVQFALGGGLVLFRTYDFQLSFDLRYQHFANNFDAVDGSGARGILLAFGIQLR